MGGLKDPDSQKEYFHAYAQTDQVKTFHPVQIERDTQLFDLKHQSTGVKREAFSQCPRVDLYIDNRKVREKVPKKYFDSVLWLERRKAAAFYI